jgi:hypothetical protein
MKDIFINGPVNIVRLEGNIDGINKIIYDMFDFHMDVHNQSKCDNIRSYDVGTFLVKTFDELKTKSDKTYDILFEKPISRKVETRYKDRYIDEVEYIFNKAFNIDPNTNKVLPSKELSNVRLHWADSRDYILGPSINLLYNHIPSAISNATNILSPHNLLQISGVLKVLDSQYIYLYKLMYETKDLNNPPFTKQKFTPEGNILSQYTQEDYDILAQKLIYKLFKSYKNKNVQDKITHIINTELHDLFIKHFKFINDTLPKLNKLINKLEKYKYGPYNHLVKQSDNTYNYGNHAKNLKYQNYLNSIQTDLNKYTQLIALYFMDLYLLRRFLDKNYITNAISYTGAHHSINYIRILVKYFDFKISHCSYIKDDDIPNATKIIKKSNTVDELAELFYSPILLQCSNLRNFPPLFD